MTITNDQIQAAALAAGFTLKPQPDGGMALHPYVFEFARAMFAAGQQAAHYESCTRCGGLGGIGMRRPVRALPALRWHRKGAVMTDQELLRLAALAYESKDVFFSDFCGCFSAYYKDEEEGDSVYEWNPLNDDGDALRLRNRINAAVVDEGGHVFVSVSRYPFATVAIRQHYEADTPTGNASSQAVDAAVRRAIVRAAAEIGLRMEKESK